MKPSRSKCSGNVEVHYEGQWLPVSKKALQRRATRNTICRQLQCGQAGNVIDYFGPKPAAPVISEIQCPPISSGLFQDCNSSVVGPEKASPALGGLRCSSRFHLSGYLSVRITT